VWSHLIKEDEPMRSIPRAVGRIAFAALTLALPSCGGGGGSSPSAPSTTPPAQSVVIIQGSSNLGPAISGHTDFFGTADFTTPRAGRLEVTVDWTFASDDIDIAVLNGSCSPNQLLNSQCGSTVAESTSSTAKPERLSISNLPAGSYSLLVSNTSRNAEGVSFQVVLF
jgi:hypothetical protein